MILVYFGIFSLVQKTNPVCAEKKNREKGGGGANKEFSSFCFSSFCLRNNIRLILSQHKIYETYII